MFVGQYVTCIPAATAHYGCIGDCVQGFYNFKGLECGRAVANLHWQQACPALSLFGVSSPADGAPGCRAPPRGYPPSRFTHSDYCMLFQINNAGMPESAG
jgi:hypothetical protein